MLLTLTTGDYYNRNGTPKNLADDVANTPIIGRSGATYGTNPVTIRYLRSDNRILREVSRVDSGITSTTSTWIADNVNDLRVNVDAGGTATVTSSSTMPYATRKAGAGAPAISFVMASQPRNPNP